MGKLALPTVSISASSTQFKTIFTTILSDLFNIPTYKRFDGTSGLNLIFEHNLRLNPLSNVKFIKSTGIKFLPSGSSDQNICKQEIGRGMQMFESNHWEKSMVSYLILDDSSVVRKVARRIIEDMGCQVIDAADATEAMQLCVHSMPDVIIVDWIMPGMSGIEFIIDFKARFGQEAANTLLVYCTHEMDIPAMAKAKRAGATHFILKPFNKKILSQKLYNIVNAGVERAA